MGYDYPEAIHGVNATQPIFKRFMTEIHENLVVKSFAEPKQIKDNVQEQTTTSSTDETIPSETETGSRDYNQEQITEPATQGASNSQRTTGQGATTQQPTTRPVNTISRPTLSPIQTQPSATRNTPPSMAHPGADVDAW